MHTPARAEDRLPAIDFVKAAAIVAVALTHSGLPPWVREHSSWDYWLCSVLVNFQVPAFLFVSGFLYYRPDPVPGRVVAQRLMRIVVPYLVASAVAYGLGFARAHDPREILFQLATASTLGIYYFIFLLAMFVPTIWGLSRLRPEQLLALCAGLWVIAVATEIYAHARIIDPQRPPTLEGLFWLARSPFNFTYAMFVTGWVAAPRAARLRSIAARHPVPVLASNLAAIGLFVVGAVAWPWANAGTLRMLYTFGVIGTIGIFLGASPVPRLVRFLSTASLGLYLYHHMAQIPLQPYVRSWPPPARILAVAAAGLLGSGLVCALGTALLGRRARVLLGA